MFKSLDKAFIEVNEMIGKIDDSGKTQINQELGRHISSMECFDPETDRVNREVEAIKEENYNEN